MIARDNGVEDPNASREARDTRVDVFVRVANVNRHAPTFEHQLYVFHLAEDATPNTAVGYVRALDMDARVDGYIYSPTRFCGPPPKSTLAFLV